MPGEHLRPAAGLLLIVVALSSLVACGPSAGRDAAASAHAAPETAASAVDPRMASELARAADRGAMCSGREAVAAGLRAEYFAQPGLAGTPMLARMEGPIDEPWPRMGEGATTPVRSARWRGWIKPPMSGRYAFHVDLPGARVQVANQWLVGGPTTPGSADASAGVASIELAAGRYAPIVVELPELSADTADRTLRLSWTAPHGARFLIPKAALFPPSDTVTDAQVTTAARAP